MIPEYLRFAYLKRHVSILDVMVEHGLDTSFVKRGDQLFGPCPLHGGDNRSAFVVSLSKNIWRCFTGCGAGGDLVDFVRRLHKMDYSQSAAYLAGLLNRSNDSCIIQNTVEEKARKPFRPFVKRLDLKVESAWFEKKGISADTARRYEAGAYLGRGFLSDCVGVRLHDIKGRPIGYAGRRLRQDQVIKYGKWKFPVGLPKSEILYNYHRVKPYVNKGVVVVEGPWDVMRLAQLKISSVALLGVNLSSNQRDILKNISPVYIMLDGDQPGQKAAVRIRNALHLHSQTVIIPLPSNLDPADLTDHQLLSLFEQYIF